MIGPHHSIIACFTGTGHGAAAWTMASSDDTSAFARTSSGSLSSRENIVGTIWQLVTLYFSTSSRNCAGSKRSITITVPPRRIDADTLAWGAEWYSGAGDRYTCRSRNRNMILT